MRSPLRSKSGRTSKKSFLYGSEVALRLFQIAIALIAGVPINSRRRHRRFQAIAACVGWGEARTPALRVGWGELANPSIGRAPATAEVGVSPRPACASPADCRFHISIAASRKTPPQDPAVGGMLNACFPLRRHPVCLALAGKWTSLRRLG